MRGTTRYFTAFLIVITLISVTASAQQIDLDVNRGYYSTRFELFVGETYTLQLWVRGFDKMDVTVAPTEDPVTIEVKDPENRIVVSETPIQQKKKITISIDTKGLWTITIRYPITTARAYNQTIFVEIRGYGEEQRLVQPSPPPLNVMPLIVVIGGVGVAVIVAAVVISLARRKPAPPPAIPPSPPAYTPPTPTRTGGGETVVMERAPTRQETEIVLAALELPSGQILPIVSPRQIFGRADFERYVSEDVLKFVSRRHFMIHLEPGGFFIEDLGSANGTLVNGTDIRGKGKVPLKSGDVIEIGGVVKLKFKSGS